MMKIGDLATATQTPVQTIRHYEREGLLPAAPRSEGNYRLYGPGHQERLAFIRHCRALDMSLDEVRLLLRAKDAPGQDCGDVNALIDAHMGHVAARLRSLRQLQRQLKALRATCSQARDAARCGILAGLSGAATPPVPPPGDGHHLAGAHGGRPAPHKA